MTKYINLYADGFLSFLVIFHTREFENRKIEVFCRLLKFGPAKINTLITTLFSLDAPGKFDSASTIL